ncbi:hypothetical protein NDU88_006067 [Pleurodeles waltl]|uniref:Uncharacterized protein n=1 Tax=Pleurodeles waltl TaxID=8319 RepID=A0AAV7LRC5_PLEWA|nr:hypothetical protein NDU88_006067 [Pleurodeles waltl]
MWGSCIPSLQKLKRGQIYSTSYSGYARRALIFIAPGDPFQHKGHVLDPDARYAVLFGNPEGWEICLINVYAPNVDSGTYFGEVVRAASPYLTAEIILAGDSNCVLDGTLDQDPAAAYETPQLVDTMRELQLQDLWRHRNPTLRKYSCYTPVANTYSRLDYCLVSETLSPLIQAIAYLACYISDNSPLLVKFKKGYTRPAVLTWHLLLEALSDAPFEGAVWDGLMQYFDANCERPRPGDVIGRQ